MCTISVEQQAEHGAAQGTAPLTRGSEASLRLFITSSKRKFVFSRAPHRAGQPDTLRRGAAGHTDDKGRVATKRPTQAGTAPRGMTRDSGGSSDTHSLWHAYTRTPPTHRRDWPSSLLPTSPAVLSCLPPPRLRRHPPSACLADRAPLWPSPSPLAGLALWDDGLHSNERESNERWRRCVWRCGECVYVCVCVRV